MMNTFEHDGTFANKRIDTFASQVSKKLLEFMHNVVAALTGRNLSINELRGMLPQVLECKRFFEARKDETLETIGNRSKLFSSEILEIDEDTVNEFKELFLMRIPLKSLIQYCDDFILVFDILKNFFDKTLIDERDISEMFDKFGTNVKLKMLSEELTEIILRNKQPSNNLKFSLKVKSECLRGFTTTLSSLFMYNKGRRNAYAKAITLNLQLFIEHSGILNGELAYSLVVG
uniref:ORF7 n=1 Tax=Little cherry virus 1 TaxID=217686 RepID=A0A0M3RPV9_9CLOS|nr:ORF7 [Little cherry virus 1]